MWATTCAAARACLARAIRGIGPYLPDPSHDRRGSVLQNVTEIGVGRHRRPGDCCRSAFSAGAAGTARDERILAAKARALLGVVGLKRSPTSRRPPASTRVCASRESARALILGPNFCCSTIQPPVFPRDEIEAPRFPVSRRSAARAWRCSFLGFFLEQPCRHDFRDLRPGHRASISAARWPPGTPD